jgi:hypothetical protein
MPIRIYGKKDCPNCARVREMIVHDYYDMDALVSHWFDSSKAERFILCEVMAEYCMTNELPIIYEGRAYGYREFMLLHGIDTGKECEGDICRL